MQAGGFARPALSAKPASYRAALPGWLTGLLSVIVAMLYSKRKDALMALLNADVWADRLLLARLPAKPAFFLS